MHWRTTALAAAAAGAPVLASAPADLKALDDSALLITGVSAITMAEPGVKADAAIVVEHGIITYVGAAAHAKVPRGARTIDGKGALWVMPGLCDMHVHLPPMTGEGKDPAWRALSLMLTQGVTTARGLAGHDVHPTLRDRVAQGAVVGPTLYVAGPPLTFQSVKTPEAAVEAVRAHKEKGFDCIKSHHIVNPAVYEALQKTAAELKIPVSGHVTNNVGIDRAISFRQQIEHMDGCLLPLVRNRADVQDFGQIPDPGSLGAFDASLAPELAQKLAKAGIWVTPTQSLFTRVTDAMLTAAELRERPEMVYVADQALEAWLKQRSQMQTSGMFPVNFSKEFTALRAALVAAFHTAGVGLLAGSDSPQDYKVVGFALHEELEALNDAGLPAWDVLKTATANPAEYFATLPNNGSATGLRADFGTLEVGKRADIVLLRADPTANVAATREIEGVVLRGKHYDRAALNALLDEIAASVGKKRT